MSVIDVKNVSIGYMTGDFKNIGLKEYVTRKLTGNYHVERFWADRHVTFSLEKGDMLGIIGTNGAGKSTILKAITGIMRPTRGKVHTEGKIAALLELASGFDGQLTVKENTYLRGALLGYTREFMDEKYQEIIEFAELEDFQDSMFKTLSSGMKSRLGFAIACLVNPDIIILDEVLSVGDGAFREKSRERMQQILDGGVTGILVSHSVGQVRELCNKVLWLDHGNQIAFGDVGPICDAYEHFLATPKKKQVLPESMEEIYETSKKFRLYKKLAARELADNHDNVLLYKESDISKENRWMKKINKMSEEKINSLYEEFGIIPTEKPEEESPDESNEDDVTSDNNTSENKSNELNDAKDLDKKNSDGKASDKNSSDDALFDDDEEDDEDEDDGFDDLLDNKNSKDKDSSKDSVKKNKTLIGKISAAVTSRKISTWIIFILSMVSISYWGYLMIHHSGHNAAVFKILVFFGIVATLYNLKHEFSFTKKKLIFVLVPSIIFGICGILARYTHMYGPESSLVKSIFDIFGGFFFIFNISFMFPQVFSKIKWVNGKKAKKNPVKMFLVCFIPCFLIYLVYYLTTAYPANLSIDSFNQISQIMGDRVYSNHHPYFHTQLIHLFVWLGQSIFNSLEAGIVMYVIFQMMAMCAVFAYAIETLHVYGIRKMWLILIMLWYILMPYNINISTIVWKDVLFGAFALWTVIECFRLMNNVGSHKKLHYVLLCISGIGSCIFRNNGFLAFLFTVVLIFAWTRLKYKKILIAFGIILLCGWIIKHPVLKAIGVENDNLAAISIQIQQISKVCVEGGEFTADEKEVIEKIIGTEFIKENYKPHRSLYVMRSVRKKKHLAYYKEHKSEFNKVWLSVGKRYPMTYLSAWVDMTRGYWYPGGVNDDSGMPFEKVTKNDYSIKRTVTKNAFSNFWHKYINLPKDTDMMFSVDIALYVWMLVLSTWYAIYKKEGDAFITFFAISIILSLLPTSPIWNCFRYSYAIFTVTPFCMSYITARGFRKKKKKEKTDNLNIV